MGEHKDIGSTAVGLMVGTAIFFDVLQWLLAFIWMDWLAGFFAFLTFFVWFKGYGMQFMTPKRISTMGGAFFIEIIPILSALPAWTGAVVVLILDHKAKKLAGGAQPAQQVGPELPRKPRRPTMQDYRLARSLTQDEE